MAHPHLVVEVVVDVLVVPVPVVRVICELLLVCDSLCSLKACGQDGVVTLQLNAGVPEPTVQVPCEFLLACGSLCGSEVVYKANLGGSEAALLDAAPH